MLANPGSKTLRVTNLNTWADTGLSIAVPAGRYLIFCTIKIPSNTAIGKPINLAVKTSPELPGLSPFASVKGSEYDEFAKIVFFADQPGSRTYHVYMYTGVALTFEGEIYHVRFR